MKNVLCFIWTAVLSASAGFGAAAAASGGPELVSVNDLCPYAPTDVNSFWNCAAHRCTVVRAWTTVEAIDVSGAVSAAGAADGVEARRFVRDVSGSFDFSSDRIGLLLLFR